MKKEKIVFNYKNLRTMDMIVCAGRGPMATITRIVTAGWKNAFNHDIAVHTGIHYRQCRISVAISSVPATADQTLHSHSPTAKVRYH